MEKVGTIVDGIILTVRGTPTLMYTPTPSK